MLHEAPRHPGIKASRDRVVSLVNPRPSILIPHSSPLPRGFTLTELMIAIAVLLVVIIGAGKVFSTASKVTSMGQATADVMQEAAAIERQLRADIEKLNPEGVFAIRNSRVRNDINVSAGGPLLNPYLDPGDFIRADQLLFFTNGVQSSQTAGIDAGTYRFGQGSVARVYWGHAFQLPLAEGFGEITANRAHDPAEPVAPWWFGAVDMQLTMFLAQGGSSTQNYSYINTSPIDGTQPPATEWLLARQDVGLMDDDKQYADKDSKTMYLATFFGSDWSGIMSARSVFLSDPRGESGYFDSFEIRNGRMDVAASRLEDVRAVILSESEWEDGTNPSQRNIIGNDLLYYPRAERVAPSMHRVDQALTNPIIGSACSSFIVEWTWDDGVGDVYYEDGSLYLHGIEIDADREQPWFGMPDPDRGVYPYYTENWWLAAETIHDENIEEYVVIDQTYDYYEAFFGYNQTYPLNSSNNPEKSLGYTPWPSAIRVTMTLHDTETKIENGRVFQFVVNLPRRVSDPITIQ